MDSSAEQPSTLDAQAQPVQQGDGGGGGCASCENSQQNSHKENGPAGQFPQRLWSILENPANRQLISWHKLHSQDDSFIIHDKDAFAERVLPQVFSHRNYPSFQRALSFHAFISHKLPEKCSFGKRKVVYYHPLWMRRDPTTALSIRRDNRPKNKQEGFGFPIPLFYQRKLKKTKTAEWLEAHEYGDDIDENFEVNEVDATLDAMNEGMVPDLPWMVEGWDGSTKSVKGAIQQALDRERCEADNKEAEEEAEVAKSAISAACASGIQTPSAL